MLFDKLISKSSLQTEDAQACLDYHIAHHRKQRIVEYYHIFLNLLPFKINSSTIIQLK